VKRNERAQRRTQAGFRRLGALLLVGFLPLGACVEPPEATITYRVSGTARRAAMTYQTGPGSTQQTESTLPWSSNLQAHPRDFLYISAQNQDDSGCVEVRIQRGSETLKQAQSCGAYVIATASMSYE